MRHCTDCGGVLGCDAETEMGDGGDRFCEACAAPRRGLCPACGNPDADHGSWGECPRQPKTALD